MFDGRSRTKLFAGCLAIGIVLLLVTFQFQTKAILVTRPLGERSAKSFDTLRFVSSRTLLGTTQSGHELTISRWKAGSGSVKEWKIDTGSPAVKAAVEANVNWAAWTDGSRIWARKVEDGENAAELGSARGSRVLGIGLTDGKLLAVMSDGRVERWDLDHGEKTGELSLTLDRPDQVVVDEDYIAATSPGDKKLNLYRDVGAERLRIVEERVRPDIPFEMMIPAQGSVAMVSAQRIFVGGRIYNSPGQVRSLGFGPDGTLIGTGAFDGGWAIFDHDEPLQVSDAIAGGVIASNDTYLVHTSAAGTTEFEFDTDRRATPAGKSMSLAGFALLGLSVLLLVDGYAVDLVRTVRKAGKKSSAGVGKRFPVPPRKMVEALAMGDAVLWAGSGLSAQSGMPPRRNFVQNIIESAAFEGWLNATDARRLTEMCKAGQHEETVDAMQSQPWNVRGAFISYLERDYGRNSTMSKSHEWLARMPFMGAVTTNYDSVLEAFDESWKRGVLHLQNIANAPAPLDFFLFKLYGDLESPASILLSRGELAAATKANSGLPSAIRGLLESNVILFAGCSLEGLIADLNLLAPMKSNAQRHWALAVVSDGSWHRKAAELKSRWGIEVLACSEEEIHSALPEFLELLSLKIKERLDLPAMLASQK